jgi:hypothetical protein
MGGAGAIIQAREQARQQLAYARMVKAAIEAQQRACLEPSPFDAVLGAPNTFWRKTTIPAVRRRK